jgi:hypothetical protein
MSALAGKWERRTLQKGLVRDGSVRPTSPVKTTPPRL